MDQETKTTTIDTNSEAQTGEYVQITEDKKYYYEFDENETYLTLLYSEQNQTRIRSVLGSPITFIIILLCSILWLIFWLVLGDSVWLSLFRIIACCLITIPYGLHFVWSCNRFAFKLVLKPLNSGLKCYMHWHMVSYELRIGINMIRFMKRIM
eukprot:740766_1